MTEQPPPETQPTNTEDQAQQTADDVLEQTPLTPAEHVTYARAMYDQPNFVIDALFASGKMDPNAGPYTKSQVQVALDEMLAEPDKSFAPEEAPQP